MFRFNHLTIEDGLSQNTVTAICQDKYGFIWLGTNNGLNRYDGYKVSCFFHSIEDTNSISHNRIRKLYEDSEGRFWIGTQGGGLNLFNPVSQNFTRFKHHPKQPQSISSDEITDIFENPKGTLWIATRHGLNQLDEKTTGFKRYQACDSCENSISNNRVTTIHSNSPDHIWIGMHGGGINKLDLITGKITYFNAEMPNSISDNKVWALHEDKTNKLWIGMEQGALNVYHQNTGEFKKYGYEKEILTNQGENLVRSIIPGIGDDFWIASDGGGLYQLNHTARYFREYRHNIAVQGSVSSNSIISLYKSKNDVLWIGSVNGGADRIDLRQKPFYFAQHDPYNPMGLNHNVVNAIIEDKDGVFWVGTDVGLSFSDNNFVSFKHYLERYNDNTTLNNSTVLCLLEAQNGEIWIGTYLGGVNVYNKKTKKFRYINTEPSSIGALNSNFVRTIFEDRQGLFWIGTMNGGVTQYQPKTNKVIPFSIPESNNTGVSASNIMKIIEDKNQNIYFGTYGNGLIIYNKNTHTFSTYQHHSDNKQSISSNQIISLYFDSDSVLWIGTVNGLNKLDANAHNFNRFFKTDGLPDNSISAITEDQNKNLWVTTGKGLARINLNTQAIRRFFKSDGLASNEFNYNSEFKSKENKLFFGGKNGLIYFDPEHIKSVINEPIIQFTELSVLNKPINAKDTLNGRILLNQPIYQTEQLNLNYKEPIFSLYFSSFQFIGIENIQYAYRLLPANNNWIDIGTRNFVSFHNLPFGKHTLEIRATNSAGEWSSQTKKITIIYKPPFWKTKFFYFFLFLLVGLITALIMQLRIHNIKKKKKQLETMVLEKTKDLQDINVLLEENQAELEMQQEEILSQRDIAHEQNERITEQNRELEAHRENLERLVKKRTEELEQAKEKAEKADQLKTAFLANMSHEIRTPMNAILGFIEIIDQDGFTPDERKHFKELIISSGQTLLNLINDIIDIAKIESGQIDVYPEAMSLHQLFKELQTIYLQKTAEQKPHIQLYLESIPEITIKTDSLRVNQILINLLDNAIKFTDSGFIRFGYTINEKDVLCFVKDSGIGIADDEQLYVFDRFNKIENSTSKIYRGAGLGLAISKNLVELLGGKIWVESKLGHGSSFYFLLPLH